MTASSPAPKGGAFVAFWVCFLLFALSAPVVGLMSVAAGSVVPGSGIHEGWLFTIGVFVALLVVGAALLISNHKRRPIGWVVGFMAAALIAWTAREAWFRTGPCAPPFETCSIPYLGFGSYPSSYGNTPAEGTVSDTAFAVVMLLAVVGTVAATALAFTAPARRDTVGARRHTVAEWLMVLGAVALVVLTASTTVIISRKMVTEAAAPDCGRLPVWEVAGEGVTPRSGEKMLAGVDGRGCDLTGADLSDADLSDADLSDAILIRADLRGADLTGADLSDARLRAADLSDANLSGADLSDANLTGVTWTNTTCPDGTNSDSKGGTCIGHL